ncbi:MAG: carboxypeptidase-like regulatory domain-containing protein [Parabacteroides sp.]|nr:carboxypeptidase-like regulatory domain-containing protein [Parabacteroides sp.]
MKRVLYYVMFSLLVFSGVMNAQNQDNFIHGQVTDTDNNPIDGVAVVLQTLDSVYVDAIVTDSLGEFKLNQAADRTYRLLFQHILFEPYFLEVSQAGIGVIRLTSRNYELDGVIVKAERPQVKVENGALKYDVPQLMKDKTVSNAFEVVKQIPGIIGGSDEIQLLGAGSPQIILNGQLTTMSVDQLTTLLKSIPSSRVKNVEVMYNAPAKYNIKGSVINVILDKGAADRTALQGEVGADYLQRHYASGKAHANLLYSTPNLTVDFLVSGDKGRMFEGEEIMARHTLENGVTEVNQFGRGNNRITSGDMRLGLDYTFKNEDKLSAAYSLGGNNVKKNRSAETVFSVPESAASEDQRTSLTTGKDKATLHNVRVQYDGHAGLTAGMDFTKMIIRMMSVDLLNII